MTALERELARLSAREMVAALGVRRAPKLLLRGLELPFEAASRKLARTLAELDGSLESAGLPVATGTALASFGVRLRVSGAAPPTGPCLVLANHPGAYDALALMSALGRDDLSILVADRGFLRALGGLSRHFVFVAENVGSRAGALRRAFSTLRRGGAVLHFPAGQIEPDAQFEPAPERWLGPWQPGVSSLVSACARAGGRLVLAGVCGVHSPHTKRLALNRAAERSGVTTLSPLLQLVQGLRDVQARVHLSSDDSSTRLDARATNAQEPNLRARLVSAIAEARRAS